MSAAVDPDPGVVHSFAEATKDRTSIRLMDLPMHQKRSRLSSTATTTSSPSSSSSSTPALTYGPDKTRGMDKDKDRLGDKDKAKVMDMSMDSDRVKGRESYAPSKTMAASDVQKSINHPKASLLSGSPGTATTATAAARATAAATAATATTATTMGSAQTTSIPKHSSAESVQNRNQNIESDSDPSFLPLVTENDLDNGEIGIVQQQRKVHGDVASDEFKDQQDQSKSLHRVGNPPHYETRQERQIRIRKQFGQLDAKRSGFLDVNSLKGFFAEVTPDKDVQQRYADELLQLCHSRNKHRINNSNSGGGGGGGGGDGNNTNNNAVQTQASLDDDSGIISNGGDGQENDNNDDDGSGHNGSNGRRSDGDSVMDGSDASNGDNEDNGGADTPGSSHQRYEGQVRYDDFEVFVEEKEERLWNLFREIDHNNDNEIEAEELQASLAKAGIVMTDAELQRFIKAMDKDGDGVIDYEEWRDFLVLLPRETTLKEIYQYVQEVIAQVGVDGDVVMPPSANDYVARYLLAGAIAGAVSRTATAPLDRLKVYLITNSVPALTGPVAQAGLKHIPKLSTPNANALAPVRQRLLWNAITELYHQGGLKTFFRGNGLNIIKIAPESAIKFYTYETSKAFIVSHVPSLTVHPHHNPHPDGSTAKTHASTHPPDIATSGRFLAGGIAGLVSQFSIYPLETIKTRIMASTSRGGQRSTPSSATATLAPSSSMTTTMSSSAAAQKRPSIRGVAVEMWQKAGWRAFYRGLGPSLVGIFPYAAIDLSVFETLKFGYMRWKAGLHEGDEGSEEKSLARPSVFVLLACGTISGSVGATTVYPLSLVRTRLQAQGTPQHPQTYSSTLDVFRKTYEKEGVRGFYKGMVPTLTKVVPAVSISYVVYEYSKRELGL